MIPLEKPYRYPSIATADLARAIQRQSATRAIVSTPPDILATCSMTLKICTVDSEYGYLLDEPGHCCKCSKVGIARQLPQKKH